jgi:hypothetical protein
MIRFFNELEKIASGTDEVGKLIHVAKTELLGELNNGRFVFGNEILRIYNRMLDSITYDDVLQEVFNASGQGRIEVIKNPSDKNEVAFKFKTSEKPFALIKIGDVTNLLKRRFSSYEIVDRWSDESFFEKLHDSNINIVMGSRAFYEGWDLNRPNVVLFINIGVGQNARKFVLQAIGRGVRIEPVRGEKKRAGYLGEQINLDEKLTSSIETLFVSGTKAEVIREIMETLKSEKVGGGKLYHKNTKSEPSIPAYKQRKATEIDELPKLAVSKESIDLLRNYISWIGDDRILLTLYSEYFEDLETLKRFKEFVSSDEHFLFEGDSLIEPEYLIPRIVSRMQV